MVLNSKKNSMEVSDKNTTTFVGKTTEIKGNINSESDVRIDGTLTGDLVTKGKCILGKTCIMLGNVYADNIEIFGSLTGNALSTNELIIHSEATLNGNIECKRIIVESGAIFNGQCKSGKNDVDIESKYKKNGSFEQKGQVANATA